MNLAQIFLEVLLMELAVLACIEDQVTLDLTKLVYNYWNLPIRVKIIYLIIAKSASLP
jgi:hypothetical protein